MSLTPVPQVSHSKRNRSRILPKMSDRSAISLYVSKALDANLDVFCRLSGKERQAKNDLVVHVLNEFLADSTTPQTVGIFPVGKVRVTFVIPKTVQGRLTSFVQQNNCSQTHVVTTALIRFLQRHNIDPYTDARPLLLHFWQQARPDQKQWNSTTVANR